MASNDADKAAARQLDEFIAKYTPEIAALAQAALKKMRRRLPGALELVYDNYNALAIGFAPSEKTSEAIFSIVPYPRWVSLFFLQAAGLRDPHRLLKGSGKTVRHIVLADANDIAKPEVEDLIAQALTLAKAPLPAKQKHRIIIKSVSAKQRPRRPEKA